MVGNYQAEAGFPHFSQAKTVMSELIGPAIHSITDGRLTFKKPHLEYLGNPSSVDITLGPGKSILIHNPERRAQLVEQLLGGVEGMLDSNQYQVAMRLDNMADNAPVDEQGRLRIPPLYLKRAGLTDKSAKACLVPARRDGWLELYSETEFERIIDDPADPWREALDRVIENWRTQHRDSSQ